MNQFKPYRIVVFARGFRAGKRYKRYTEIVPSGFAYMGWTETQHYQEARLPSAGSFLYPGLHAVRRAALEFLALPANAGKISEKRTTQRRANQRKKTCQNFCLAVPAMTDMLIRQIPTV